MKAIGKNSVSSILKYTLMGVYILHWLGVGFIILLFFLMFIGGTNSPSYGLNISFQDHAAPYEINADKDKYMDMKLSIEKATITWKSQNIIPLTFIGVLGVLGILVINIFIIWLLIKIMDTLTDGTPFVPDNAPRLNLIAWALIIYTPVAYIAKILVNLYVKNTFDFSSGEVVLLGEFNWQMLFMGLIMLVVAELFRKGTALQEHEDLTV